MKSVVPTFVLVIGFTIMVMIGGSLILAQTEISAARQMHTNCLVRLQASAYNEDVYEQCVAEVAAVGEGWSLEPVEEVAVFEDRKARRITMNYRVTIPFFGIDKPATITAYGK